jgi:glycosyltransferase involved in cell wall biosynthesis
MHMQKQGIPQPRIRVVHNGIDPCRYGDVRPAELAAPAGAFCVGTVAHLSPKKGYRELVQVAERLPEAHFVVAGEGPLRRELEQTAVPRLNGRLHLLGWRDDIPALMRRFDVFCLPAAAEPFGLVFLEAMAAATPIVAFRSGGAPEVVREAVTGLLAPPGDVEGLAACLRIMQQDAAARRAMGRAGRDRLLDCFTLDRTARELLDCFERAATYREEP